MIVVDSSVLIAHLDDSDVHHEAATRLMLDASDEPLAVSTITLAEVLLGPARHERIAAAQAAIRSLALTEVPLGTDAASRLATLRAETNLKMPDCCVLLAAQDTHALVVLTLDERLRAAAHALG